MTLAEIAASLPNGFHDAELIELVLDCATRVVELRMLIDVSDVSASAARMRPATVTIRNPDGVSIDGAGVMSTERTGGRGGLWIGGADMDIGDRVGNRAACSAFRFVMADSNASITIYGGTADLAWGDAGP